MKSLRRYLLLLLFILIIFGVVLGGSVQLDQYGQKSIENTPEEKGIPEQTSSGKVSIKTLSPVEVKEYEGKDLSSIEDFRENAIKGPQYIDIEEYRLTITGMVNDTKTYTYDEVVNDHQSYEKVVTLNCVSGWSVTILWQGVLVKDLFEEVGIDPEAKVVILYAEDGYSTSLPLDFIIDNNIMMAYKMNGVTLPPERGFPFQLVSEDKFGYKWIRWITRIELSDDVTYRGFWEKAGYSNDGDLNGSRRDPIDDEPPVIIIEQPITGSLVDAENQIMKGTVTDNYGIESISASYTVNEDKSNDFILNSDGSFEFSVALAEGSNSIKITAIDRRENKISKSILVTFTPITSLEVIGDTDGNGIISDTELLTLISLWSSEGVDVPTNTELLNAIAMWNKQ